MCRPETDHLDPGSRHAKLLGMAADDRQHAASEAPKTPWWHPRYKKGLLPPCDPFRSAATSHTPTPEEEPMIQRCTTLSMFAAGMMLFTAMLSATAAETVNPLGKTLDGWPRGRSKRASGRSA